MQAQFQFESKENQRIVATLSLEVKSKYKNCISGEIRLGDKLKAKGMFDTILVLKLGIY